MYEQLLSYLKKSNGSFDYMQEGERMEIRVRGKDWSPIRISKVAYDCYCISWAGVVYPHVNTETGFKRIRRLCQTITAGV